MTYWKAILSAGLLSLGFAEAAQAQSIANVLTADRIDEICTDPTAGPQFVNTQRFASALVDEAKVPYTIRDRANTTGAASNSVTPDEDVYLLTTETAINSATPAGEQALARLSPLRQALNDYLRGDSDEVDRMTFRVVKLPSATPASSGIEALLGIPASIVIACTPPTAAAPPTPSRWDFRLRGKVEDMNVRADGDKDILKKQSAATISFQSNAVSNTDTFDVNLVGGVHVDLSPDKGRYLLGLQPYAQYERRETTGDGGQTADKDRAAAGLLADFFTFGDSWALSGGLYPQYTSDFELDSEQVSATAFLVPDFAVNLSESYRFYTGAFNYVGSMLRIKPELKLIATSSYVLDEGANPDLADQDDLYGLGGEAGLAVRFDESTPVLNGLTIAVSYRWLDLFSTSKSDLARFEANLRYDLFGTENAIIELGYVDGEDMDTQQEEEYWRLALGLRF